MMETVTVVGAGGASPEPVLALTAGVVPPAAAPGGGTSAAPAAASGAGVDDMPTAAPGGDAHARVGLAVGAIFDVVAGTLRIFEWLNLPRSMFNRRLLK